MTFKNWIKQFREHDNPQGDLARDIEKDKLFPDHNEYGAIFYHLTQRNKVNDKVLGVFKSGWRLYLSQHGNGRTFFEVFINPDKKPVFSDFVDVKEANGLLVELELCKRWYEILSEETTMEDESNLFQIEIEDSLKKNSYVTLDELINEVKELNNNIVYFPNVSNLVH